MLQKELSFCFVDTHRYNSLHFPPNLTNPFLQGVMIIVAVLTTFLSLLFTKYSSISTAFASHITKTTEKTIRTLARTSKIFSFIARYITLSETIHELGCDCVFILLNMSQVFCSASILSIWGFRFMWTVWEHCGS